MLDPVTTAVVTIAGEELILLPERAIYWPRTNIVLIADWHIGKEATFRTAGIAVPDGALAADLDRLSQVIDQTGAARLIILGDLIHAAHGRTPAVLETLLSWRTRHKSLNIDLIRGNHDRGAGDPPPDWDMTSQATASIMPFVLTHHPVSSAAGYVLAGHLHPSATLAGRGRQKLTLPCFWFGSAVGVLPAFGSFTGNATIRPASGDRVFVVMPEAVLPVALTAVSR